MSIVHQGLTLTPLEVLVSVIRHTHLERYERTHAYTVYSPAERVESSAVRVTSVRIIPEGELWLVVFRYRVTVILRTSRWGARSLVRYHHSSILCPRSGAEDLSLVPVVRLMDVSCQGSLTAVDGRLIVYARVGMGLALYETQAEPRTLAEVVFSLPPPGIPPRPVTAPT